MSPTELLLQPHKQFLYTMCAGMVIELHGEKLALYTANILLEYAACMKLQTVIISVMLLALTRASCSFEGCCRTHSLTHTSILKQLCPFHHLWYLHEP